MSWGRCSRGRWGQPPEQPRCWWGAEPRLHGRSLGSMGGASAPWAEPRLHGRSLGSMGGASAPWAEPRLHGRSLGSMGGASAPWAEPLHELPGTTGSFSCSVRGRCPGPRGWCWGRRRLELLALEGKMRA
ncbi:hypothetical protein P7K49_004295 [Saguinus oedipus]|uniref:Uncharacterized protein n=1 Tax=Saguinus oedipus TaxID=9490 RepID=A0ABQ9W6X2_SAGOE|nr:hypothetical protein P7K49_004295 [Saguinus oedipus]